MLVVIYNDFNQPNLAKKNLVFYLIFKTMLPTFLLKWYLLGNSPFIKNTKNEFLKELVNTNLLQQILASSTFSIWCQAAIVCSFPHCLTPHQPSPSPAPAVWLRVVLQLCASSWNTITVGFTHPLGPLLLSFQREISALYCISPSFQVV